MQTSLIVKGMTCGNCVQAVTTELKKILGVEHVDVDLATGQVNVTSSALLDQEAIAFAIDEAGYELEPID